MFGMPGLQELLIIGFIVLILFGSRLPKVMRDLGSSLGAFREGLKETTDGNSPASELND